MSVLVTGSLDHSSTTSPMATLPMPFLASSSGPGQAAPLASMISAAVTVPSSATVRAVIWVSILLGGAMGDGGGGVGASGRSACGGDDLRIGELVADLTSVPDRLHDPRPAERGQVLRDRGLRHVEVFDELANFNRTRFAEVMDELEATRTGQSLEKSGLQYVDAIGLAGHGWSPMRGI